MDDIIDIFSQPLKSQQELEEEVASSDDESDATSLTSRSLGDRSDIEEPTHNTIEEPEFHEFQATKHPEELDNDVSGTEVSRKIDTLHFQEESDYKVSDIASELPCSLQEGVTPSQQFVFPAPQAQPQIPAERRFNVNPMTPIEERTESSIFQHSLEESPFLPSPIESHFQCPSTPVRKIDFSNKGPNSSPFEEYIPKPPVNMLEKAIKRPALQPKRSVADSKAPLVGPIIK